MKKRSKNQTMGYLPADLDRSVFERRIELINSLPLLGRLIINDYENYFTPNETFGFSFANLLQNALNLYMSETVNTGAIIRSGFINSTTDILFNSLAGFKSYSSSGGTIDKPATKRILTVLSDFYYIPNVLTTPYVVYGESAPFTVNTSGQRIYPNPKWNVSIPAGLQITTAYDSTHTYNYSNWPSISWLLPTSSGLDFSITKSDGKIYNYQDLDKAVVESLAIESRTYMSPPVTGKNYWSWSSFNIAMMTPAMLIQTLKDTITVIRWLESESSAIEIRGNVDGVKIDAYEGVLNNQLTYLNNLTDYVAGNLNQEKLDGQKRKDDLIAMIEQKKKDLELAKIEKAKVIASMKDFSDNYVTILEAKKAQISASIG